jgi:hypothetical protein
MALCVGRLVVINLSRSKINKFIICINNDECHKANKSRLRRDLLTLVSEMLLLETRQGRNNSDAWRHASGHLFYFVTDTNQGGGKRIEFIAKNPTVGKPSVKRKNVRSILFTPHNQIFYPYQNKTIEVLCLFDMRKNPKKRPY